MSRRSRIKKILKKSLKHVGSSIGSAPSRLKQKIRGRYYDYNRGYALWKQGYGKKHESALSIARKGKSGRQPIRKRLSRMK